ncbi:hypothetical protein Tco_0299974 [Tanacetum coccineum]
MRQCDRGARATGAAPGTNQFWKFHLYRVEEDPASLKEYFRKVLETVGPNPPYVSLSPDPAEYALRCSALVWLL